MITVVYYPFCEKYNLKKMNKILVIDTSVLMDLERGALITEISLLPFIFRVPDLLYQKELAHLFGNRLLELGLEVISVDGETLLVAQQYFSTHRKRLAIVDCVTLALAKSEGSVLLTGDKKLRMLAMQEKVSCHGLLWILDQFYDHKTICGDELAKCLKQIINHPRARLPKQAVQERLHRYSSGRIN